MAERIRVTSLIDVTSAGEKGTPPPNPLPEAERGSKTSRGRKLRCRTRPSGSPSPLRGGGWGGGWPSFRFPLSASGRGLGGGVGSHALRPPPSRTDRRRVYQPAGHKSSTSSPARSCHPRCRWLAEKNHRGPCHLARGGTA